MRLNKVTMGILLGILLVSFLFSANYLYSSTTNGTGYVTVSTPPSVSNINLYDSDDGTNLATTTTTLTPNDPMTLTFDVNDPDGLDTLDNITVVLYHSTATTVDGADNVNTHATFFWSASTNTWTVSPSSTTWAVNNTASSVPTNGTSGTVVLVFTPSKVALYSSSGEWTVSITVYDKQGQSGTGTATNFNAAPYSEVSLSVATFSFGLVGPGVVNASLTNPSEGYITITVISNGNFGVKITATDWLNASGVSIVDLDTFNSLLVDDDANPAPQNLETGQSPFYVRNTATSPQWSGYSYTDETGMTINLYLWVTLPSDIPPGEYHLTLTVEIVI